jgi:hypothetical protein
MECFKAQSQQGLRKTTKTTVSVLVLLAEIRAWNVPNTTQESQSSYVCKTEGGK